MQRLKNRGFILTETLIVSVVLLVSFVFVFTQFLNIFAQFQTFERYNDVDSLYTAKNLETFIKEDNYEGIVDALNANIASGIPFYEFTNCDGDIFTFPSLCDTLIEDNNVARALFTEYDITDLKDFDAYANDFSHELKEYISYLAKHSDIKQPGAYRVIVEMENGTFATFSTATNIGTYKSQYRYKSGYLAFNGTDDYISLDKLPTITNQAFSFSAWIKWSGLTGAEDGIWMHSGPSSNTVHVEFNATGLRVRLGAIEKSSMATPTLNKWTYLTVTYDGSTAKIYYDGMQIDSFDGSTGSIFGEALPRHQIGDSNTGDRLFNGSIKEVKIYLDRTLTPAEIINDMNNINPNNSGLEQYYKLTEGSGIDLIDYSDNNHTKTNALDGIDWEIDNAFSDWIDGDIPDGVYPEIERRMLAYDNGK